MARPGVEVDRLVTGTLHVWVTSEDGASYFAFVRILEHHGAGQRHVEAAVVREDAEVHRRAWPAHKETTNSWQDVQRDVDEAEAVLVEWIRALR